MAYTETTVSAGELAAKTRDVPLMIGNNVLERYQALAQWRVSGSWASGTDISDNTTYPVWYAWDRNATAFTQPSDVNGQTEVSLIMDLTAGTDDEDTIDGAFIFGHNFHSLGGNISVTLDISDVNTFSGGDPSTLTLATWTNPTTSLRLGSLNFRAANNRYTSVRYLRLRIRKTSGSFSTTEPRIAELWVGRRRQFSFFPKTPWDEASTESDFVDFVSDAGVRSRYVKSEGRRIYEPTWNPDGNDGSGLDFTATLRGWWNDCRKGTLPSVFVESPGTAVVTVGESASIVYPEDAQFYMPRIGPFEREVSLRLVETSPYLEGEL